MWIGIEFDLNFVKNIDDLIKKSHENGLMILKANINTIRFSPSLIIEDDLIDKGLKIFEKSIIQSLGS